MIGSYTVTSIRGCKALVGDIPVDDFVALTRAWAKMDELDEWIVDAGLAHATGANFVIGPKEACLAWRAEVGIA